MEDKKLIYYLWLTKIKGIGPVTSRKLIDYFGESENIYNSGIEELIRVNGIGTETANSIYSNKDLMEAEKILDSCREKNIGISVYNDEIFPRELNKYEDNPILIYYSGKLYKELKGVGIIGARRCNEYGKKVAVEAASYLGSLGIPVISGLAKGIDSYAHTACIKASGFTAAVLGCGIDICYPEEHRNLMEKIKETGLLISEYPPGTSVKKENFPKRNRLISSLSEKILIPFNMPISTPSRTSEKRVKASFAVITLALLKMPYDLPILSSNWYFKSFSNLSRSSFSCSAICCIKGIFDFSLFLLSQDKN